MLSAGDGRVLAFVPLDGAFVVPTNEEFVIASARQRLGGGECAPCQSANA